MTVVAGVDNSPVSEQVVARAIEQARWRGSGVHLVHVSFTPMIHADAPIDWTEVREAQRAHVWSQLEAAMASLVLGSTSHRAIHLAQCDVLVVKVERLAGG